MALNCGNNEGLDALKDLAGEIKGKLAEGKAALADLQSKATDALGKLGDLKAEVPEGVSSFQEDLQALSTKIGEEYEQARNAILEKYDGLVDDLNDAVSSIPALDEILSGSRSLPDLCSTVQNIEVKVNEDGTREKKVKAAAAPTPNVKAEDPPQFIQTVVDNNSQPSSVVDGAVRAEVGTDWMNQIYFPMEERKREYWNARTKELNAELASIKETEAYKSALKILKDNGIKGTEAVERGLFNQEQQAIRERYLNWKRSRDGYSDDLTVFENAYIQHRFYLVGSTDEETWNMIKTKAEELLQDSNPSSIAALNGIYQSQEIRKDVLIAYYEYYQKV